MCTVLGRALLETDHTHLHTFRAMLPGSSNRSSRSKRKAAVTHSAKFTKQPLTQITFAHLRSGMEVVGRVRGESSRLSVRIAYD